MPAFDNPTHPNPPFVFPPTHIQWMPYHYSPYMATLCVFLALQWVAVLGRVYVRAVLVKAFGWDDVACLVTLILTTAFQGLILTIWRLTDLYTLLLIPPGNWLTMIQLTLATLLMYIVATAALKVSLGLLLLRVLVKKWMRIVIYVVMAVSLTYGVAYFFVVLFQCHLPQAFPHKIIYGQCLPRQLTDGLSYAHAALTAVADMTYAILPIFFLWDAVLSHRAKISVGAILVLGSVGCICTFIRIGWISYLTGATKSYYVTTKGIVLLSVLELSIGLICISLATYRPLVSRYIHRHDTRDYYCRSANDAVSFASRPAPPDMVGRGTELQSPIAGGKAWNVQSPVLDCDAVSVYSDP